MARKRRLKLARIDRIKQIDRMLAFGFAVNEIAEKIGCAEKTVRRDLQHRFEERFNKSEAEMVSERAGLILHLQDRYAATLRTEKEVEPGERYHLYDCQIRILHCLIKLGALDMLSRQQMRRGFVLPDSGGTRTLAQGRIEIVEGPPVYAEDDSDQQVVIELPKTPDDRENCDPATVQMAETLSQLKRQTANGSHRT